MVLLTHLTTEEVLRRCFSLICVSQHIGFAELRGCPENDCRGISESASPASVKRPLALDGRADRVATDAEVGIPKDTTGQPCSSAALLSFTADAA